MGRALDPIPEDASARGSHTVVQTRELLHTESVASTTGGVIDEEQARPMRPSPARPPTPPSAPSEPEVCSLTCSPTCDRKVMIVVLVVSTVALLAIGFIVTSSLRVIDTNNDGISGSPQASIVPSAAPVILTDDFLPTNFPSPVPTIQPTTHPTQTLGPSPFFNVDDSSKETIDYLSSVIGPVVDEEGTPQSEALRWILWEDPSMVRVDSDGEQRVLQRFLLADFYHALDGHRWWKSDFLTPDHECEWEGIRCTEDMEIRGIRINANNLVGSLPSEMVNLTSLEWISLTENYLNGSIPDEWWNMKKLTWLDLSTNYLDGRLSHRMWSTQSLRVLDLHGNGFTGAIPAVNSSGLPLTYFDASSNQLSSSIPSDIWVLGNLTDLYLHDNFLTGTIPPVNSYITLALKSLWLDRNQLNGAIPESIWKAKDLEQVLLDSNKLTSSIPQALFSMTALTYIDLSSNALTGNVNLSLSNMPNLLKLDLSKNKLSGTIGTLDFTGMLSYLSLFNNNFSGDLPSQLPAAIVSAWFHNNQFTGTIPLTYGIKHGNLTSISFHGNNRLSGTIYESFCGQTDEIVTDCENSTLPISCSCCISCEMSVSENLWES